MGEKILVVDDEKEIADLIEVYLKNDGYTVYKYYNGTDALRYIEETELDLAILDIMLPDIDGFRICQKIREKYFYPVIMLTAKVEDGDKIMEFRRVLFRSVKTQLRRYTRYNVGRETPAPHDELDIRGLQISRQTHKCLLNGKAVALTPIEFEILWYLCSRRGTVVSSEELFEAVWGEQYLDNNNTVMTHIARLREKMKEPARRPKYIKTIWGVGYTIE